jgi:hypothetical protein
MPQVSIPFYLIQVDITGRTKDFFEVYYSHIFRCRSEFVCLFWYLAQLDIMLSYQSPLYKSAFEETNVPLILTFNEKKLQFL